MLKYLRIQNIILIENEEIPFEKGLNVITGETGAGKSAIIEALALVVGEKADSSILRKGCDKGIVEAGFDLDTTKGIATFLEQAGIDHNPDDMLIIRREVSATGKSRCFINNQMAQLTILRELGPLLIERVGQHANQRLRNIEMHRHVLDTFALNEELLTQVKLSWRESLSIRKQLQGLVDGESQRLRDIEVCRMELEELQEAHFKENEEEELFAEYSLLSNTGERKAKVQDVISGLTGDKMSILTLLNRHRTSLESLSEMDSTLAEPLRSYQEALIELQEVAYTLRNYQQTIEHNPERMTTLDSRLALLNRLKRKYGANVQEMLSYQAQTQSRLTALENTDEEIEELRRQLEKSEKLCEELCMHLTALRKKSKIAFEQEVVEHLRSLNMPKVEFHVRIESQKRSENGDDKIEFFLQPNVGEHPIPVSECASGGELSRIMLAIRTILAGREKVPTLIFDEIDSNIGGQTAVEVGDKLYEMGNNHQVLCITHFQQVARQATHHLQISKHEENGRTITKVRLLGEGSEEREEELARMLGLAAGSTAGALP